MFGKNIIGEKRKGETCYTSAKQSTCSKAQKTFTFIKTSVFICLHCLLSKKQEVKVRFYKIFFFDGIKAITKYCIACIQKFTESILSCTVVLFKQRSVMLSFFESICYTVQNNLLFYIYTTLPARV